MLSRLRLEKKILPKGKDKPAKLPANTFVAKFGVKWNGANAAVLRDQLRDRVCEEIKALGLHATCIRRW